MNRLIIIGNGFDLAHGLKTKYSDFLEYYWTNITTNYDDGIVKFKCKFLVNKCSSYAAVEKMVKTANQVQKIIDFEIFNNFFLQLNQSSHLNKWVDIEMFYYSKLKALFVNRRINEIRELNNQFEMVKNSFAKYIEYVVNETENLADHHMQEMVKLFAPLHTASSYNQEFYDKLPRKVQIKVDNFTYSQGGKVRSQVHVLNFNYTKTLNCYLESLEENTDFSTNHIHGEAGNLDNKVVFGFGDERDKLFTELEDANENEYLRFMKSSFYLQTTNYYKLLNFLESNNFVVDVFGHSCGLSDRTMLKTIFEHSNCSQIFLSYHIRNDSSDNFNDLSLNISRHFEDKQIMRSRVANKKFCIALPQRKSAALI